MSKCINDIIKSLKDHPTEWSLIQIEDYRYHENATHGVGIQSRNIRIINHANPAILALDMVYINTARIPISYIDTYRLHKAVRRWFKAVSATHLTRGY